MELYVVRHGETIVNVKQRINARNIIGLNKKGKKQAEEAAKEIKNYKIDLIFCSPLRRTRQTCKIINKNKIKVIYDTRLLERDAGSMQFKKIEKINFEEWYDTSKNKIYKDTEGFKSVIKRIKEFTEELKAKYPEKNILIVTHGDVCRAIYAYQTNITNQQNIGLYDQKNCEIKKYNI